MRIFNQRGDWTEKVNFVDDNNVLVGYDMEQNCCEYADWFIADAVTAAITSRKETPYGTLEEMAGWAFDPAFFKRFDGNGSGEMDEGGMVVFRLVHPTDGERFLHLFNAHNGYYSHGFALEVGGTIIREGDI